MFGRFDRSRANAISPLSITGGAPVLWLDGAGSGVVTQANGLISAWADKSGNGYTFAQSTDANKPYLTRSDSLENRLLYSEDFSQAAIWSKGETTVSANATTAPNGTATADKLQETDPTADHNITQNHEVVKGASYTYSIYAKKGERNHIRLRPSNDGFPDSHYAFFNLDTGAVGSVVGAGIAASIESAGDGWYKCSVAITADASHASAYVQISISTDGSTLNYDGTVGSGVYLWGAHFARTGKGYITTTTFPIYAGLNGRAVPYFPGAATQMTNAALGAVFTGEDPAISVFVVAQTDAIASETRNIFAIENSANYNGARVLLHLSDSSPNYFAYKKDDAAATKSIDSGTPTAAITLLSFISPGTTGSLYANGSLVGSADTDLNLGTATLNKFSIGSWYSPLQDGLRGYLPEVIVFNRALSSSERIYIENYLRIKWGI